MSENYYSPINSTSVLQHRAFRSLNESPLWLIRDGLVPLLWFFRAFPDPGKIKTRLLVHADFAWTVPAAWRDRAGTYEVVSLPIAFDARPRNKRFILTGPFGETICGIEFLKAALAALQARVGPTTLRKAEVAAFLPARFAPMSTSVSDTYHGLCLKEIFGAFGTSDRFHFLDWNHMRWTDDLCGELLEFNDRFLWADNFLVHHVLSKGSRLAGQDVQSSPKKGGRIIELSPYHGFRVNYNLGRSRSRSRHRYKETHRALLSAANISFPWQTWMRAPKFSR